MSSKYQKAISEIKVSDELKEKIKMSLEQENLKNAKKGGIFMHLKRGLIAISTTLATLVCGGAVYAALGGTIEGIPVTEWLGIKFSQNYTEYEEEVQNQYIENEYGKIELQSTVCDDGFTILKFGLKIKDTQKIREKIFFGDWSENEMNKETIQYRLSFNDTLPNNDEVKDYSVTTNNNNLIIDGKQYYINGSVQSAEENIRNEEYTIYQMWFLTDEELKNKEKFNITLNNVALDVNGVYLKFNDRFNIELSKSKAKENTKEIKSNKEIIYKKMKKSLNEVKITPLQNIVKLSTTMTDASYESLSSLINEDYVGEIKYVVTDQNGRELRSYNTETSREIIYNDGNKEKIDLGNFYGYDENLKNATISSTEYIAIEKREDITELNIEVYEINVHDDTVKNIGKYSINLVTGKTSSENKNEDMNSNKEDNSQKNDTASTANITTFNSSNIEWEEYPSNFEKEFSKIFEEPEYPTDKAIKTAYSIIKNKLYDDIDELYSMGMMRSVGDYYGETSQETNYNQYDYSLDDKTIEQYKDIIQFKVAKISPTYLESSESNYLKDLTKQAKEQYELLKAKDYNIDNGYYFGLDKMIIMNGNNLSKEDYKNNSRAKKVKVTVNGDKEYIFELKDTNKAQAFDLDYKQQSIAKPIDIRVEVLETYSGDKTQKIYISDIQFGVTTNIPMGI